MARTVAFMCFPEYPDVLGAVTGFLCHSDPAAAYTYVQENDEQFADKAIAAVFAGA